MTHEKSEAAGRPNDPMKRKGKVTMSGDAIVDSFGPSRLPPRVVFMLPGARKAVGKEINDLLTPHGTEPPAMVVVSLGDSRFRNVPMIFLRWWVKGKV